MAHKLSIVKGIVQDATVAGYPIHQRIVAPKGGKNVRTLLKITPDALCYHNTANTSPTADDLNHARYLQNLENADKTYLSVHFFVDQDSITQCIPIDEMAYHAGTAIGNKTSIAIEICENGDNAKAEKIAQELGASLLMTYPNLAIKKHQDYSGKYCPRVILGRNGWSQFVQDIIALSKPAPASQAPAGKELYRVRKSAGDAASQIGAYSVLANAIKKAQENPGYAVYNSNGVQVYPTAQASTPAPAPSVFKVRITANALYVRSGPGTSYSINRVVRKNEIYHIVEEKSGWGRLRSGAGWISLSPKYTARI